MSGSGAERRTADRRSTALVAYFTMEVALEKDIPTFAGGLGVLAGDTLKAAADLGLPLVAISLVHREGYFRQELDSAGNQIELPATWSPETRLEPVAASVSVTLENQPVTVRAWRYWVVGVGGSIPVYLLDTSSPDNPPAYREITDQLYAANPRLRLMQEAVLGMGGVAMLRAMGYLAVTSYHMNEGHSALLGIQLARELGVDKGVDPSDSHVIDEVRRHCVFTTHTPVPAGHDVFPFTLVKTVLGSTTAGMLQHVDVVKDDSLNMTHLALRLSRYVNGVAMRHREISSGMFPDQPVNAITNGVHAATWVSPPFQRLFDRHIPEWREENFNLRYVVGIDPHSIAEAHREAKEQLLEEVRQRTGRTLDASTFTIGFARRATAYKRADLLLDDLSGLRRIARDTGPFQIVYAGKAHPNDQGGKDIIRRIITAAREIGDDVPVIYLPEHSLELAALLVAGVDLWLNTPLKPQEASGTSGMKAALNGVPSLSVLDGWWVEGHVEGVTGWAIGEGWQDGGDADDDQQSLYEKLERNILPLYYTEPEKYVRLMQSTIALNGSFFTAERMVLQYAKAVYGLSSRLEAEPSRRTHIHRG